jgi:hypothetical protein
LAEMMDSAQINKIVLKVLLHQQIWYGLVNPEQRTPYYVNMTITNWFLSFLDDALPATRLTVSIQWMIMANWEGYGSGRDLRTEMDSENPKFLPQ